ncbi:MAG: S8 family serine peptidase, partial [Candidatus Zixiibacteriota bacterium]
MMKHSLRLLPAAFLGTLIVISAVSFSQVPPEEIKTTARPVLMPGRLEVQFETDVPTERLTSSINGVGVGIASLDRRLQKIGAVDALPIFPWHRGREAGVGLDDMSRFFELVFSEEQNINDVIENLRKSPYVRSVSPVYAMPLYVEPNDPNFSSQWGLKKINDTAAWNVEKGSDTVKIAMIDSGVLYSHPDLRDNIWVNPGEDLDNDMVVYDTDDSNNIDNDGNGLDDLIGYDFFTGFSSSVTCEDADCGVPDNNPIDWNGHGTHCAGIAAAVMNNSLGVASVAGGWGGGLGPYAGPRIMCIRVGASGYHPDYGHTGYVNSANCATGIDYAVTMGADIISCSWGMSQSAAMTSALLRADSAGVVVFHAAGNENSTSGDYYDTWSPPSVGHKLVVTVAWTTSGDVKAYSSNYGWWIDICAPGSSIYSTYASNYTATYGYASGTSMAAPHVAGVAALIKSHMPDYKRDEIVPLIIYNADPMPNEQLWLQGQLGSGRVNAYNCLDSLPAAAFSAGPDLI